MERSLEHYQPSAEDIKEGKRRKIYTRVPLDQEDESTIAAFRQYTSANNIPVPDW
jgi:hypothetical protein